jgi:hypothetical protein
MNYEEFRNGIIKRFDNFRVDYEQEDACWDEEEGKFVTFKETLPTWPGITLEDYLLPLEGNLNYVIYKTVRHYSILYITDPIDLRTDFDRQMLHIFQTSYLWAAKAIKVKKPLKDITLLQNLLRRGRSKEIERDYYEIIFMGIIISLLKCDTSIEQTAELKEFIAIGEQCYSQAFLGKQPFLPMLQEALSLQPLAPTKTEEPLLLSHISLPTDSPELLFKNNPDEDQWATWVKEFMTENRICKTVNARNTNVALATMWYFRQAWLEQKVIDKSKETRDPILLQFFINRCGVIKDTIDDKTIADKSIHNKLSDLRNQYFEFKNTKVISGLEEKIKKFVTEKLNNSNPSH